MMQFSDSVDRVLGNWRRGSSKRRRNWTTSEPLLLQPQNPGAHSPALPQMKTPEESAACHSRSQLESTEVRLWLSKECPPALSQEGSHSRQKCNGPAEAI